MTRTPPTPLWSDLRMSHVQSQYHVGKTKLSYATWYMACEMRDNYEINLAELQAELALVGAKLADAKFGWLGSENANLANIKLINDRDADLAAKDKRIVELEAANEQLINDYEDIIDGLKAEIVKLQQEAQSVLPY